MSGETFPQSIGLGNLLTILTLVVGVAVTWATGLAEVRAIREQIGSQERRVAELHAYMQGVVREQAAALALEAGNVRALQTGAARQDARLDAILTVATRIEARLDRMEGQRP